MDPDSLFIGIDPGWKNLGWGIVDINGKSVASGTLNPSEFGVGETPLALLEEIEEYQNYITGHSVAHRSQFVGEVKSVREDGWAEVETKNRFQVGDTLEIIHPQGNRQVKLETMFNLDGAPVQVAQGSPVRVRIPLEGPVEGALIARLL